jgi:hypothetical protein
MDKDVPADQRIAWPLRQSPKRLNFIAKARCNPLKYLVPGAGLEPARAFAQRILSPLRLPFRHPSTVFI